MTNATAAAEIEARIAELSTDTRDGRMSGKPWHATCSTRFADFAAQRLTRPVASLTDDERLTLITMLRNAAIKARISWDSAVQSRPSYAPKGRLTASEQGAIADYHDAVNLLHGAQLALAAK